MNCSQWPGLGFGSPDTRALLAHPDVECADCRPANARTWRALPWCRQARKLSRTADIRRGVIDSVVDRDVQLGRCGGGDRHRSGCNTGCASITVDGGDARARCRPREPISNGQFTAGLVVERCRGGELHICGRNRRSSSCRRRDRNADNLGMACAATDEQSGKGRQQDTRHGP